MESTSKDIDYTNIYRCETPRVEMESVDCALNPALLTNKNSHPNPNNSRMLITFPFGCKSRMDAGFFHYNGSFTTPPCEENVEYLVVNAPVQVRAAAMDLRASACHRHCFACR